MEVMVSLSADLNSSKQYPRCEKGNTPPHPGLRSNEILDLVGLFDPVPCTILVISESLVVIY